MRETRKQFDKRLAFVGRASGFTGDNAFDVNRWYVDNKDAAVKPRSEAASAATRC